MASSPSKQGQVLHTCRRPWAFARPFPASNILALRASRFFTFIGLTIARPRWVRGAAYEVTLSTIKAKPLFLTVQQAIDNHLPKVVGSNKVYMEAVQDYVLAQQMPSVPEPMD